MSAAEQVSGEATLSADDMLRIMGGVLTLADQSDLHRQYELAQFTSRIVPALLTDQFRYYDDQETGQPLAFVCWAMTTQEGVDLLADGDALKSDAQWVEGDQLVFVEFLAPYGGLDQIREDLRMNVFPDGTVGISHRPVFDANGDFSGMRKKIWRFDRPETRADGPVPSAEVADAKEKL